MDTKLHRSPMRRSSLFIGMGGLKMACKLHKSLKFTLGEGDVFVKRNETGMIETVTDVYL